MEAVIETRGLTKHFGKIRAVENVSLRIERGEIYGFLGLNGAGKTTTIRMLLGMIRPTRGEVFLEGTRVHSGRRSLWNRVGFMVEVPSAYPDLTVFENVDMFRRLRFMKDSRAVDRVLAQLKLTQYRNRPARHLSLGNFQRLGLAKALLHEPEILILDEPANGLDPAGIVEIRLLLRELAQHRGVTILISSHILGEISKIATRIGIIHEGRLIRESATAELDQERRRSLKVRTRDLDAARALLACEGFTGVDGGQGEIEITDERVIADPAIVSTLLVRRELPPIMLQVEEEDLESYFFRVIRVEPAAVESAALRAAGRGRRKK